MRTSDLISMFSFFGFFLCRWTYFKKFRLCGVGGEKGAEKGRRKKEEEEGKGGEEEESGQAGLHLNELLNQSQSSSSGRTSQTLQEFGGVLRWWSVARVSVSDLHNLSVMMCCTTWNNFQTPVQFRLRCLSTRVSPIIFKDVDLLSRYGKTSAGWEQVSFWKYLKRSFQRWTLILKLVGLFSIKRFIRDLQVFAATFGKSFRKCHFKLDRVECAQHKNTFLDQSSALHTVTHQLFFSEFTRVLLCCQGAVKTARRSDKGIFEELYNSLVCCTKEKSNYKSDNYVTFVLQHIGFSNLCFRGAVMCVCFFFLNVYLPRKSHFRTSGLVQLGRDLSTVPPCPT